MGCSGDSDTSYIYAEEELEKNIKKGQVWRRATQYLRNQMRKGFQEGQQKQMTQRNAVR